MSGFEVAGVILGAIPLIISALEHYKDGKGAAATFVKWRGLLDTLIFRLKLQRTFFYLQILELLREAGVREAIERPDLSETECIQLLRSVKAGANLEEHLGPLYPAFTDVLGRYEACLSAILSKIGHIQRLPQHQKYDLAHIVAANTPGADGQFYFRERLAFTIERRSLKTLLDELTEERLSLKAIIKGIRTQREFAAREPSHEAHRIASIFFQVQAGAQALYSAMSQGCTCRCIDPHRVMMRLDNRLPQQRQKAIMAIRKNQGTTFSLIFTLEGSLQEAVVKAALADDMETDALSLACSTAPVIKLSPAVSTQTTLIQATRVTDICRTAREARVRGRKLHLQLASYTLSTIDNASERCRKFAGSPNLESLLRQGAQDEDSRMTPKQRTLLALDVAAAIPQLRETTWLSQAWDKRAIKFLVTHAAMTTEGPLSNTISAEAAMPLPQRRDLIPKRRF
ncbi:hypothetical protein F5X68DRAFT_262808 [Plectosphaerella plurivora]|uniref:DUF7580 domain-containing protein n=1 Tax=Plectosphaerella plurivora TaxID=936078 RepID=A0A9P8V8T5_9PEZI|nr:hypothetical protein F5X68DRAFT_262808 [Plectosphaerella plurivora]